MDDGPDSGMLQRKLLESLMMLLSDGDDDEDHDWNLT